MEKPHAIRLRKKVQECFRKGMPIAKIARKLGVSRPFVYKWKEANDATQDQRGWQKGKKRKYTNAQEQKIVYQRKKDMEGFFSDRN